MDPNFDDLQVARELRRMLDRQFKTFDEYFDHLMDCDKKRAAKIAISARKKSKTKTNRAQKGGAPVQPRGKSGRTA